MAGIGDRIRELRGKISRENFANKYGIHRNTLERWEKGLRSPSEDFLCALSVGENVSLDWVKFGEEREKAAHEDAAGSKKVRHGGYQNVQHLEKINSGKEKKSDMSDFLELPHELVRLNKELLDSVRQNGDLRVEVERLTMEIERRDARIVELERQLAEALKPQERPPVLGEGSAAAG